MNLPSSQPSASSPSKSRVCPPWPESNDHYNISILEMEKKTITYNVKIVNHAVSHHEQANASLPECYRKLVTYVDHSFHLSV